MNLIFIAQGSNDRGHVVFVLPACMSSENGLSVVIFIVCYFVGTKYGYYYHRDFILVISLMLPFRLTTIEVLKFGETQNDRKNVHHRIQFPVSR